jgi:DNA-binding phage protein
LLTLASSSRAALTGDRFGDGGVLSSRLHRTVAPPTNAIVSSSVFGAIGLARLRRRRDVRLVTWTLRHAYHLCYAFNVTKKNDPANCPIPNFHDRLLVYRMEDPDFRAEFERASREVKAIDAIVNDLDSIRATSGMTKAELARRIGKNPASVRRLFSAPANPELRTVVAMADALDADVLIVSRSQRVKRTMRTPAARLRQTSRGPAAARTPSGSSRRHD